jgi:hypothetical protein
VLISSCRGNRKATHGQGSLLISKGFSFVPSTI